MGNLRRKAVDCRPEFPSIRPERLAAGLGHRRAIKPMTGIGASRPLRRIPTIVSFLNPQPALSLVGGDRSSCPIPAISQRCLDGPDGWRLTWGPPVPMARAAALDNRASHTSNED